jgi:hypothetical protein
VRVLRVVAGRGGDGGRREGQEQRHQPSPAQGVRASSASESRWHHPFQLRPTQASNLVRNRAANWARLPSKNAKSGNIPCDEQVFLTILAALGLQG